MKAFNNFKDMDASFWAFVKFVSENLGYTERGEGFVKRYSIDTIRALCEEHGINASEEVIAGTAQYSKMRAAEKTIREITGNSYSLGFDDDPRSLAYILDDDNRIIGASSRRFDGAYPNIENPKLVWEIKEYYYATTFGSRVADGVYETQLDGFEFKELYERTGRKVYHVLFIDAYRTWWIQGKSYLCRLVDAMNSGVVDEVIVGREVLTRWPELLHSIMEK